MEIQTIDHDIKVFYIQAQSFPDGIIESHKKLHEIIPFSREREYYGVSRPENGAISYKAAATELFPGEAQSLKLDTLLLRKGSYVSLTIKNYLKDLQSIDRAFKELLASPGLDPGGYCVEWYLHSDKPGLARQDVECMIRLED
jgi:hypothetical protein